MLSFKNTGIIINAAEVARLLFSEKHTERYVFYYNFIWRCSLLQKF